MESDRTPAHPKAAPAAIWSLVLGIISVSFGLNVITAIPGLILGFRSLKKIDGSLGALKGKEMAVAGIVCSSAGILLFVILPLFIIPAFPKSAPVSAITRDSSNIRQIILACKSYAEDHDGDYPTRIPPGAEWTPELEFQTSTEVFNHLLKEGYVDTESIFWIPGNPDKPNRPNEDGILSREENCYLYVAGQSNTSSSLSPLVADEMKTISRYGAGHPFLKTREVNVGYNAGNVGREKLDTDQPGAVARTRDGVEIFSPMSEDSAGGLLAVPVNRILLP